MERNRMDVCLTNNHLPNFSFQFWYGLKVTKSISKTKTDKYLEIWRTLFIHNSTTAYTSLCTCWENYYFARGLFCSWLLAGDEFPLPSKRSFIVFVTRVATISGGNQMRSRRFLTKYRYIKHFTLNEYNTKLKLLCWYLC